MRKLIVLLAITLMAGSGYAVTSTWNNVTGLWTDSANWSGDVPDGSNGNSALIAGGTAQITSGAAPGGAIAKTYLSGASGANIEISGDAEFKDIYMAEAGESATISQTGGNMVFSGNTTHIARYGTGTYNLSGGTLTHNSTTGADSHTFIGVYDGSVGTFNQTGGTFTKNGTVKQNIYVGFASGATGTINLSGNSSFTQENGDYLYLGYSSGASGTLNISDTASYTALNTILTLGQSGHGEVNQTGGDIKSNYIILGNASSGSGNYTISGGSVDVGRYMYLHYGDSHLTVSGSDATSIKADRFLLGGKTLTIELDENGSTLIEVDGENADGNTYYNAYVNGTWEIDTLAGFDGTVGTVYDLMWTGEDFLNTDGLSLVNLGATEFEWSILENVAADGSAGTGKMLQVTVIPEPATLGLIGFVGIGICWIRRRFTF